MKVEGLPVQVLQVLQVSEFSHVAVLGRLRSAQVPVVYPSCLWSGRVFRRRGRLWLHFQYCWVLLIGFVLASLRIRLLTRYGLMSAALRGGSISLHLVCFQRGAWGRSVDGRCVIILVRISDGLGHLWFLRLELWSLLQDLLLWSLELTLWRVLNGVANLRQRLQAQVQRGREKQREPEDHHQRLVEACVSVPTFNLLHIKLVLQLNDLYLILKRLPLDAGQVGHDLDEALIPRFILFVLQVLLLVLELEILNLVYEGLAD